MMASSWLLSTQSPLPGPWGFLTSGYILGLIVMVLPRFNPVVSLTNVHRPSSCIAYKTSSYHPDIECVASTEHRRASFSASHVVPYFPLTSHPRSSVSYSVSHPSTSYQSPSCSGPPPSHKPHTSSPFLTPSPRGLHATIRQPSVGPPFVPSAVHSA